MENSNNLNSFYRKLIIIIVGGIMVALVTMLWIVPFIKQMNKPAYLDVWVLPEDVKVVVDNKEYNNAVYSLEPGSYTASVSGEGVQILTLQLELVKNQTTGVYLVWNNDKGEWRQYDSKEVAERNAIGKIMPLHLSICGAQATRVNCDAIAVQFGRNVECDNELCIAISGRRAELTDEVLNLVRDTIRGRGYSLDDYEYFYKQNDSR